jgi:hypothetical protein
MVVEQDVLVPGRIGHCPAESGNLVGGYLVFELDAQVLDGFVGHNRNFGQ